MPLGTFEMWLRKISMLSFGISQTAGPRRRAASWASSFRQKRPADITPRLWQAQREGSESQLHDLREQVDAYERLQWGKDKLRTCRRRWSKTQEDLALRLGLKTQQVQRYEATEYESASFARIRKVVEALALRIFRSQCGWCEFAWSRHCLRIERSLRRDSDCQNVNYNWQNDQC